MRIVFDGLGADDTSDAFRVDGPGSVHVTIDGDPSGQTITMKVAQDEANYDDFYADGSVVTFTVTGESRKFDLHPGMRYRFHVGNGGTPDVDIYVDGRMISRV